YRGRSTLLLALWALVILLFFSFSTRQEYYVIPAIPGLALLIGVWMAREQEAFAGGQDAHQRAGRIAAAVLLGIAIAACLAAGALLLRSEPPPQGAELAELLTRNPQEYALSMGHVTDLTPQALGMFRVPMAIVVAALLFGSAAAFLLRRRSRISASNLALAAMMTIVLFMVHRGLTAF